MKIVRLIPLLLLFFDSCVEPFELKNDEYLKSIVVEGMITDRPGPYMLTLKYSTRTALDLDKAEGITGATVTLHDSEGNIEQYRELGSGSYGTSVNGMRGIVGRSYHITFRIGEKEYASRPAKIFPAGAITDMHATFEEDIVGLSDPDSPHDGIRVFFSSRAEEGAPNLLRWRWTGTYEVETFPGLRRKAAPIVRSIPDPIPCSGLVYSNGVMSSIGPCECCKCYMPEYGTEIQISENQFFQTTEFNDKLLATLPYETKRFYFKYRIKMEQLSLDEEAYDYWRLVKSQQDGQTDLFQPNTVRIRGNVACVTTPEERVLGYFGASAVAERTFDMPKSLNKKMLRADSTINDCRLAYRGASNQKPLDW